MARARMAYVMDLTWDDIADLDMPLGMLYAVESEPIDITLADTTSLSRMVSCP